MLKMKLKSKFNNKEMSLRKFRILVSRSNKFKKISKRYKRKSRKKRKTKTSLKVSWKANSPMKMPMLLTGNASGFISAIWMIRATLLPCSSPCLRHTRVKLVTERSVTSLERRTSHQLSPFWLLHYKELRNMERICIILLLTKQSTEVCQSHLLNLNSSLSITSQEL